MHTENKSTETDSRFARRWGAMRPARPRKSETPMGNMLQRFKLSVDEVTEDKRLALAVAYKLQLEKRIKELKLLPITAARLSAVAARFGFTDQDRRDPRVQHVIEGIAQSKFYLAALKELK